MTKSKPHLYRVELHWMGNIGQGTQSDSALASQLHDQAHQKCFIANSVNFPVQCEPSIQLEP